MRFSTVAVVLFSIMLLAGMWLYHDARQDLPEQDAGLDEAVTEAESTPAGEPGREEGGSEAPAGDQRETVKVPDETNEEDGAERAIALQTEELDLAAISDVDARREALIAAHEDGDPQAANKLYQLAEACMRVHLLDGLKEDIEEEQDPEREQQLRDIHEELSVIKAACLDSELGDFGDAVTERADWTLEAADAGHGDAMYRVVFTGLGQLPRHDEESQARERALRQGYLDQLREACHADSLYSMGVHLSRESAVTQHFELHEHWDREDDRAMQMEGFAHRYMAAQIKGEGQPEQAARHPDHSLTAAEEAEAVAWARGQLSDCP
ncbi:hypothetical protein VCB98_12420 [Gammaproteobacteria bacterium AB-CW1]|uniref:Uncharacterized protein n=1 Tax=Natronospira elongata TaxID=3110268 RepID=A0AAP6ML00_9GAMM|nr:hypothetical protein [Gammaproteobacteria bacterium AB-CW1]